jgi:hypothetical protein
VLVPPAMVKRTRLPPRPRGFPARSRVMSSSVARPPTRMVAGTTDITVDPMANGPGTTVMVGSGWVTGWPSSVAVMVVALPASRPVKVAA